MSRGLHLDKIARVCVITRREIDEVRNLRYQIEEKATELHALKQSSAEVAGRIRHMGLTESRQDYETEIAAALEDAYDASQELLSALHLVEQHIGTIRDLKAD